jgi:hypothetical protein
LFLQTRDVASPPGLHPNRSQPPAATPSANDLPASVQLTVTEKDRHVSKKSRTQPTVTEDDVPASVQLTVTEKDRHASKKPRTLPWVQSNEPSSSKTDTSSATKPKNKAVHLVNQRPATSLARISEVEDGIQDEQDEQDHFDNVDDQYVEANRDSSFDDKTEDEIEDVSASYKMSAKEKQLYKPFSRSTIGRQHTTHRDLQLRTASHVACVDGSHAVFHCPACQDTLDADITVSKFYRHVEHPEHWDYFAATGIPYEIECGRGFLDKTHQLIHYASGACPVMAKLPRPKSIDCPGNYINKGVDLKATEKPCELDGTRTFAAHSWAMKHWNEKHAEAAYKALGHLNCFLCKLGFPLMDMYVSHFLTPYGGTAITSNTHALALKRKGLLWNPSRALIQVTTNLGYHPPYVELYTRRMASIDERKDHAIMVFRQSTEMKGF